MTAGHKHRFIPVRDGRLVRALQAPLYVTTDVAKVDRSPYPYGPLDEPNEAGIAHRYYLSALSILHRWTGLTLQFREQEK